MTLNCQTAEGRKYLFKHDGDDTRQIDKAGEEMTRILSAILLVAASQLMGLGWRWMITQFAWWVNK